VFDLSGVGGLNPHWLRTTPSLVTVKFGLGVGFDPLRKVKNPHSSLNLCELMCNILSILLTCITLVLTIVSNYSCRYLMCLLFSFDCTIASHRPRKHGSGGQLTPPYFFKCCNEDSKLETASRGAKKTTSKMEWRYPCLCIVWSTFE